MRRTLLLSPFVSCDRTHYRPQECDAVKSDICTDVSYNILPMSPLVKTVMFPSRRRESLSPKRQYTPEDANFQTTAAKLICFGIIVQNCKFVYMC